MAVGSPVLRLITVVAAFGLLFTSDAFARQGSPLERRVEVSHLRFQGNRLLSDRELQTFIETQPAKCKSPLLVPFCLAFSGSFFEQKHYLDRMELARDMDRLRVQYYLRGYRSTAVDTVVRRSGDAARIIFVIDEGEPLRMTNFTLDMPQGIITRRGLRSVIHLEAGQPYDLIRVDSTILQLREALWDKGYSDAIIRLDTALVPGGIEVTLDVEPRWISRVSGFQIAGNQKIGDRTIRNAMYLKPGDRFIYSEMLRSQRALYESGLYNTATVDVTSVPGQDSLKIINVDVQEAKLREARIGAGFSTVEFFQLDGYFANNNWNGGGRRVSFNVTLGNLLARQLNGKAIFRDALEGIEDGGSEFLDPTWRASSELRIPSFQSPANALSLTAFAQRRSLPGIFVDRSFGGTAVFTREVQERFPISLSYQFEVTRVDAGDLYFCVNFGLCDPPTIAALRSAQRMSPLSLSATLERSNDPLDPTRGYNIRGVLEHASTFTLSDYRYNRVFGDAAWYVPIRTQGVLALHLRGGWVSALGSTEQALGVDAEGRSILHPRKRFYAGGSQSVRGYGEGQLGPRILTIPRERLEEAGCSIAPDLAVCNQAVLNNRTELPDSAFTARPLGGNVLAETSVELRFPIMRNIKGAVFVDAALVGESGLSNLRQSSMAVTPGFGIRYQSLAGPIRVDLGYNPFLTEDLPVVTEVADNGRNRITGLQIVRASDNMLVPARRAFAPTRQRGVLGFLSQFTLHLSIGQAF